MFVFFFFFQAEDGIRDKLVTGVQTCALPILAGLVAAPGEVNYSASKHAAMAFTLGTLFDLRRSGVSGVQISAVCPDGIWTPMLEDKLDDPAAAGSFSGQLLTSGEVATAVGKL